MSPVGYRQIISSTTNTSTWAPTLPDAAGAYDDDGLWTSILLWVGIALALFAVGIAVGWIVWQRCFSDRNSEGGGGFKRPRKQRPLLGGLGTSGGFGANSTGATSVSANPIPETLSLKSLPSIDGGSKSGGAAPDGGRKGPAPSQYLMAIFGAGGRNKAQQNGIHGGPFIKSKSGSKPEDASTPTGKTAETGGTTSSSSSSSSSAP